MNNAEENNILLKLEKIEKKQFAHFVWGLFFATAIGIIVNVFVGRNGK